MKPASIFTAMSLEDRFRIAQIQAKTDLENGVFSNLDCNPIFISQLQARPDRQRRILEFQAKAKLSSQTPVIVKDERSSINAINSASTPSLSNQETGDQPQSITSTHPQSRKTPRSLGSEYVVAFGITTHPFTEKSKQAKSKPPCKPLNSNRKTKQTMRPNKQACMHAIPSSHIGKQYTESSVHSDHDDEFFLKALTDAKIKEFEENRQKLLLQHKEELELLERKRTLLDSTQITTPLPLATDQQLGVTQTSTSEEISQSPNTRGVSDPLSEQNLQVEAMLRDFQRRIADVEDEHRSALKSIRDDHRQQEKLQCGGGQRGCGRRGEQTTSQRGCYGRRRECI